MDVLTRSRRILLSALLPVAAACGAQKPPGPVGVSTAAPAASASPRDAGLVAPDAGIPVGFESSFAKMNLARFVSNGHAAGRWDVDVYANEAAKAPFLAERGEVPAGAKLIKVHRERAGAGGRGPVMMMEKREKGYDPEHGDWRYVVVTASGELVKDGPIEGCSGCHDDAPHDHLFRMRE